MKLLQLVMKEIVTLLNMLIKLVRLAPSVDIGASPGQQIPMEITVHHRNLLLSLKYSNMSTRTVDCNP